MSLFLGSASNEECFDLDALYHRNWPADLLIKRLILEGKHLQSLEIHPKDYEEIEKQLAHCFNPDQIYSSYGSTKIIRGSEKIPRLLNQIINLEKK